MVLMALDELHRFRPPGNQLQVHEANAYLQSVLIDLRSLIGFLLSDAKDFNRGKDGKYRGIATRPNDVKPSWYTPNGVPWYPRTARRRRALYSFYDPVGTHLAHIAIKSTKHPGPWPIVEAAVVVGQDLDEFVGLLEAKAPTEARRFADYELPLRTTLEVLLNRPYAASSTAPVAEQSVARARRLLRTQLGWPHTSAP
jgi:hypothetical protein